MTSALVKNTFAVRGVSFLDDDARGRIEVGRFVMLIPDPDNVHHEKKFPGTEAIRVEIDAAIHIGWVPAELCGWFAQHAAGWSGIITQVDLSRNLVKVEFDADEHMPRQASKREETAPDEQG